ncbi:MAG: hypothetical protein ACK4ZJ_13805, partial [Allorhizobium sp.]
MEISRRSQLAKVWSFAFNTWRSQPDSLATRHGSGGVFQLHSTFLLTAVAMLAFAANSLLAREALGTVSIEAAGYTAVRIVSGALVLYALMRRGQDQPTSDG